MPKKRAGQLKLSLALAPQQRISILILLCLLLTVSLEVVSPLPVGAVSPGQDEADRNIDLHSFVTWWSHDATGYHPAIVFTYDNVSGKDLSKQMVHFQARFTDLRNGYVTVARKSVVEDQFPPNLQRILLLRGPSSFELPIDQANWPQMECKVMCRVGDVDDSGTENLILARLESIVMTDEEAQDSLNKRFDIRPPRPERRHHRPDHGDSASLPGSATPPKPLSATQLSLNSPPPGTKVPHSETKVPRAENRKGLDRFLAQGAIAGLGDNFLQFEKTYRQQPSREDEEFENHWTWIRYSQQDPGMTVYDGTKTSNADVLVVRLRREDVQSESQIAQLIKAMAGKFKGQPLEHFKKSVSYRPNGLRVEMSSLEAAGYHAFYINPSKEDNNYIVIISRQPANILPELFRKTQMLKFVAPLFAEPEQE